MSTCSSAPASCASVSSRCTCVRPRRAAARDIERLARAPNGGLGARPAPFGLRYRGLRLLRPPPQGRRDRACRSASRRRQLGFDRGDLAREPGAPVRLARGRVLELIAPAREIGKRRGQLGERLLGRGECLRSAAATRCSASVRRSASACASRRSASSSAASRASAASASASELRSRSISRARAGPGAGRARPMRSLGARFLALERLARDRRAAAARRRPWLRRHAAPAARQRRAPDARGFGLLAGALGDDRGPPRPWHARPRELGVRGDPAQMKQQSPPPCGPARRDAVADRLLGLALERVDLAGDLADDVLEAREVLLGGAQPQLRLVPARVQPGDAGGLLEHAAALLGLGLDDLADAALVHQRRRARAGRGIGEQDLHVARAHLAAVDPIGRAVLALDPARHVEGLVLVELRRRLALANCRCSIATSALLRAGRLLVPEKITSSMSAARMALCEVSPMTQRSASTRFDLPQPFGPTTPVRPGSIRKSVGSTKDLKPSSRRRVSFMSVPGSANGNRPLDPRVAARQGQPTINADSAPAAAGRGRKCRISRTMNRRP